jgi:hypothetical protein
MTKASKYSFVDKRTLELKVVPRHQEADFFRAIESLTGLDPSAARAFLDHGKPIQHPSYTFLGKNGRN